MRRRFPKGRDVRTPEKVLITGGREVGGLTAFAMGLSEGFAALGIPSEVIPPQDVFRRWWELRDPGVLKILSTTAVFAAPIARRAICVAHGFPRVDVAKWAKAAGIFASYKAARVHSGTKLVAVSDYVASQLRCLFNVRVEGVIRNPVRSCFLEQAEEAAERRYVTYVGRILPAKNLHRLLPAMRDLQSENPGLRICIIGDGPQLESLRVSFGAEPAIEFAGNLEPLEVRKRLRQTKVFVSGNEMEPFGITYLEALSQGCAVAMPASGGGVEIALDHVGTQVQLFPLSFERREVLSALRRAFHSSTTSVSLSGYDPKAVAGAYLEIGGGLLKEKPEHRERRECPSTRYV